MGRRRGFSIAYHSGQAWFFATYISLPWRLHVYRILFIAAGLVPVFVNVIDLLHAHEELTAKAVLCVFDIQQNSLGPNCHTSQACGSVWGWAHVYLLSHVICNIRNSYRITKSRAKHKSATTGVRNVVQQKKCNVHPRERAERGCHMLGSEHDELCKTLVSFPIHVRNLRS